MWQQRHGKLKQRIMENFRAQYPKLVLTIQAVSLDSNLSENSNTKEFFKEQESYAPP